MSLVSELVQNRKRKRNAYGGELITQLSDSWSIICSLQNLGHFTLEAHCIAMIARVSTLQ